MIFQDTTHLINPLQLLLLVIILPALNLQILLEKPQLINKLLVSTTRPVVETIGQLEPGYGGPESNIQLRTIGGERVTLVVLHEGNDRVKLQRLGETVYAVSIHDPDESVHAPLAQGQGVVAGHAGSVSDQEGSVGHVLHDVRHFFPASEGEVRV